MATNIKGPAIYLAQFAGEATPFNSWDAITTSYEELFQRLARQS
jgi:hypothetical protein